MDNDISEYFTKIAIHEDKPNLEQQESVLLKVSNIGIYHQTRKLLEFENTTLFITKQRIIFSTPQGGLQIELERIKESIFIPGFFTQSPKIQFLIAQAKTLIMVEWKCIICETINNQGVKCIKCGVEGNQEGKACPSCTFINHKDMIECEVCQFKFESCLTDSFKLSFRAGGSNEVFGMVNDLIKQKSWCQIQKSERVTKGAGVKGIIDTITEKQTRDQETIKDAFQDAQTLLQHVEKVLVLAQNLSKKEANDPESQNSLLQLGFIPTVSSKTGGTGYYRQLAMELCDFLMLYSKRQSVQFISLSDTFCLFNRVRGLDLISPQEMLRAGQELTLQDPFHLKTYASGVMVIVSKEYQDDVVIERIMQYISQNGSTTASQLAKVENINVLVALELLIIAETKGSICRDDTLYGLVFFENKFI